MARPNDPEPMRRKLVSLPEPLWKAISAYRFAEHISTEVEAVRRLIQAGLDAEAKKKGTR